MAFTEAAREAFRASQAEHCTLVHPKRDRVAYWAYVARDDIPARVSPTVEVEWVAYNLPIGVVDYGLAPSRVAAIWIRRLRLNKALKDKFWSDTWPYYMENRLALELRAAAPPARKRGAVQVSESNALLQASIDQFKKKGGDGNGG
jgi:hypothetical protein